MFCWSWEEYFPHHSCSTKKKNFTVAACFFPNIKQYTSVGGGWGREGLSPQRFGGSWYVAVVTLSSVRSIPTIKKIIVVAMDKAKLAWILCMSFLRRFLQRWTGRRYHLMWTSFWSLPRSEPCMVQCYSASHRFCSDFPPTILTCIQGEARSLEELSLEKISIQGRNPKFLKIGIKICTKTSSNAFNLIVFKSMDLIIIICVRECQNNFQQKNHCSSAILRFRNMFTNLPSAPKTPIEQFCRRN